jgi:hypothetical protein
MLTKLLSLPGDKICLFGFSRGAYVARALAGFLTKCGLISKDNREQMHFVYELYKREDVAGIALAARFREGFARHVAVEFVGVWTQWRVSASSGIQLYLSPTRTKVASRRFGTLSLWTRFVYILSCGGPLLISSLAPWDFSAECVAPP